MKHTHIYVVLFLMLGSMACHTDRKQSTHGDLQGFVADSIAYDKLLSSIQSDFQAIEEAYDLADSSRKAELTILYEETELKMVEAQKLFIREHPSSPISLKILYEIDWSFKKASDFREYLEILDTSLHRNEYYLPLNELVKQMELVEPGNQAPDFEMNDTQGNSRKLSDQYRQTKYLLLDFWASHCGPCRLENKNIRNAHDLFHQDGFDVLGVSTDTRREQWINAIETDGLTWLNLCSLEPWNENPVVELYALRQVSQNYLIDGSGKIIATDLKGPELISTLEELLY